MDTIKRLMNNHRELNRLLKKNRSHLYVHTETIELILHAIDYIEEELLQYIPEDYQYNF